MKYFKWVLIVLMMITVISFTACSNAASGSPTYTVTYDDGLDEFEILVPYDIKQYHEGDTVTVLFTGVGYRDYYGLSGWSNGTTTFTSSGTTTFTMGNANVTLTAQWDGPYNTIGTKIPSVAKSVGDIVFSDGSAIPYSDFTTLDETTKDAKKTSAIALIFYKGKDLNSDDAEGHENTTTSRTLGVGLKHKKSGGLAWCLNTADAFNVNITTIQCPSIYSHGSYTFTGDKNGSDNLEQIEAFTGVDDTATANNYPAFYYAKNYKDQEDSRVAGTNYESGWYLPSIAELYKIYTNGIGTSKVFSLNTASEALGGDKFATQTTSGGTLYWSSTQNSTQGGALRLSFSNNGSFHSNGKQGTGTYVCAIREFN